jgi:hypothetical protein
MGGWRTVRRRKVLRIDPNGFTLKNKTIHIHNIYGDDVYRKVTVVEFCIE